MQFTTLAIGLLAAFSTASEMPTPKDVFDPQITFPSAGSVFTRGQTITVFWDTSSLPAGTPNTGMILLGALTDSSENLDVDHPLAQGFLLTDGHQDITFPGDAPTGNNIIVALLGSASNISPEFTLN